MAESAIKDDDARFKFRPTLIQTAEDAAFAYLRGDISEDEFRAACNRFGVLPGQLLQAAPKGERPDAPFKNKIPDDIYRDSPQPTDDAEYREKLAEVKANTREEATEAHEAAAKEIEKPSKVAESAELQQQQAELAQKESDELAKVQAEAIEETSTTSGSGSSSTTTTPTKSTSTTTKSTSSSSSS